MQIRKYLLLSAGVTVIVALFAMTEVLAQSSCTSKTTCEGTGNFKVNVAETTQDGRRIYTYSLQSLTGKNPNKIFFFAMKGLKNEEGFTAYDIFNSPPTPGTYLTPHNYYGSFPPADAWKVVHHEDGVVFTTIAKEHIFQFNAKERFKPEESLTTVLIGIGSTFEHCGPIYGPTGPAAPEFGGSPVSDIVARICFKDGCCYWMTAGATDNIVKDVVPDDNTPNETVGCGGSGQPACLACTVTDANCEQELSITFCPPLELGRPPLQGSPGGICYAKGKKFPC
jgi:hypothetical protein